MILYPNPGSSTDYVSGLDTVSSSSSSALQRSSSSVSSNAFIATYPGPGFSFESPAQMRSTYNHLNLLTSLNSPAQYPVSFTSQPSASYPSSYLTNITGFTSAYPSGASGASYTTSSSHLSGPSHYPFAHTGSPYDPRDGSRLSAHRDASSSQLLSSRAVHNSRTYPDPRAFHTGHPIHAMSHPGFGLAPTSSSYPPQIQFSTSPFGSHSATRQTALYNESTVAYTSASSRHPILSTSSLDTAPYTLPSNDASTFRIPKHENPKWNPQKHNQGSKTKKGKGKDRMVDLANGTEENALENLRLEGEIKRVEMAMHKNINEGYCARPEAVNWYKNDKNRLIECECYIRSSSFQDAR